MKKEEIIPKVQPVPLSMINTDDESFRMTFAPDLKELKISLEKVGLINPVILRGEAPFQVVSGFRRIVVAHSLGWKTIETRTFGLNELTMEEGFKLNFYENLGTRTFNLIEASLIATGFLTTCGMPEHQVINTVLPLLGFQPGKKIFHLLSSLLFLSKGWREVVVTKNIPLLLAGKISSFSLEDQEVFLAALSGLHVGQNKINECLEMAEEISKRDGISLLQLFASEPFSSIYQNVKLNLTEKTENFRRALKSRRFPGLTQQKEEFHRLKKSFSLPPSVSLNPPDFFEGDKLKISFSFGSPEELCSILEKLKTASQSEALKDLLRLL